MIVTLSEPTLLWIAGGIVASIIAHLRWTYRSHEKLAAALRLVIVRISRIEEKLGIKDITNQQSDPL